jgi:hypothetical protein
MTTAASDPVIDFQAAGATLDLPAHVREVLSAAPLVQTPENRPQLLDWALGRSPGTTDWTLGNRDDHGVYEAVFHLPGNSNGASRIVEAVITKARNGLAINFPDPAMRRRDPDAMVIGDSLPTDKPTYDQRFGEPFDNTRQQTLDWLKTQELVAMPFYAGPDALGYGSLLIVPRQAAFFAAALADLQGMIPRSQVPENFKITGGVLFVAPPFRHTTSAAANSSSTTALSRIRKSSPTTSIPARARKKASTPCSSTSASAKAGPLTIAQPSPSSRPMRTNSFSCTKAPAAAAKVR